MKRYPSIQALRAIESVARNGALWRAASELNVTRSAISHQLRLLEKDLGFKILERSGNRTEITPRARAYAEDVRRALNMIASSTERVSTHGLSGRLTVSAPPGFAAAWLCLNMADFLAENPDVVLNVLSSHSLTDTSNPEADTFITFGHEARPHVAAASPSGETRSSPAVNAKYILGQTWPSASASVKPQAECTRDCMEYARTAYRRTFGLGSCERFRLFPAPPCCCPLKWLSHCGETAPTPAPGEAERLSPAFTDKCSPRTRRFHVA